MIFFSSTLKKINCKNSPLLIHFFIGQFLFNSTMRGSFLKKDRIEGDVKKEIII
ncbi:hypothetical protein DBT_2429 [Dissulfuribacter thermophilus]|uniref:Uncharacterized protein n=1 Tax=Dissulfuribacter thermophilus TaxID=1156395 RepID=A0A1B9F2S3_9BACT|nr:hypothetical protein DBT_2429 [Dissulfuribacter thermophilus]